jgi:hypothetical protein
MLQVTMGNVQPALRALITCISGLSEQKIGLEHAFICLSFDFKEALVSFASQRASGYKEAQQMAKFARSPFEKTGCLWSPVCI